MLRLLRSAIGQSASGLRSEWVRGLQSASIKDSEVEKFTDVRWWDREGPCRPLHEMNPVRAEFIRTSAVAHFQGDPQSRRPLEGRSVLDVGCGGGILSESLGRLGGEVLGIDVVKQNVAVAEGHLHHDPHLRHRISYRCQTAESLVAEGAKFDLVVASEVVEHVHEPVGFLHSLSQLMMPHGLLCVTTLNRTLPALLGAVWMAEYVLRMLPQGTHDWNAFLTPAELTLAGQRVGLKLDQLAGMTLNPLTGHWYLSSNTAINYAASMIHETQNPSQNEKSSS